MNKVRFITFLILPNTINVEARQLLPYYISGSLEAEPNCRLQNFLYTQEELEKGSRVWQAFFSEEVENTFPSEYLISMILLWPQACRY